MIILESAIEVQEFLDRWGFNQVKLPGGTEKHKEHYSGVIVYTIIDGKIFFLGIPYDSHHHLVNKNDDSKKENGETPEKTATRELFEETGIALDSKSLELVFENKVSIIHTKYFFVSLWEENRSGKIFDFTSLEKGRNPVDEETGTPFFCSQDVMNEVIWDGHKEPFLAAAEKICEKDKDLCQQLFHLL